MAQRYLFRAVLSAGLAALAPADVSIGAERQTSRAAHEAVEAVRAAHSRAVASDLLAYTPLPPQRVRDVVRMEIDDAGDLLIRLIPPRPDVPQAMTFPTWPGAVTLRPTPGGDSAILLHRRLSGEDVVTAYTHVILSPMTQQITRDEERIGELTSVQLIRSEGIDPDVPVSVTLRVRVDRDTDDGAAVNLTYVASDFHDLLLNHPDATRRYLSPIFSDLGYGHLFVPPAAAVWQVLGRAEFVTDDVRHTVRETVDQLDADAFPDREAAATRLREIGPAAATVLRTEFSLADATPERRAAVDAFLAQHSPITDEHAETLRDDVPWLIGALRTDDAHARRLAADRLRELLDPVPPSLGAFDPDADVDTREASVIALLKEVEESAP